MEILNTLLETINLNNIIDMLGFVALFVVIVLAMVILTKNEQILQLQSSLNKLKRAFDELDEQAKLIVKTDLELNKTQEELDRKVSGLYTLQRISRLISTTLDEAEMFRRIEEPFAAELGFERGLILLFNEKKELVPKLHLGYTKEETNKLCRIIVKEFLLFAVTKEGKTLSSIRGLRAGEKEKIVNIFDLAYFVIAPVLTQDGVAGIMAVGNEAVSSPITEGDEEIVSILAAQLGQSLENTRLFEQVYRSHQDLELKVQQRTKELAQALEDVKRISKMKSDFISAVSHELRTPLTSIKGYASILMSDKLGAVPQAVKERLDKINKHSDSLVKLINDLLDVARIESGRVKMEFKSESIKDIVESAIDLLIPQIKERQIELKVDIPKELKQVFVDRSQIDRVFINLIGNAIKFTPQKGIVTIQAEDAQDSIQINVIDTGVGISEEDIPRVFQEFYRADNPINQQLKGTGLGLPLTKSIIEAHKGRIWVTSKLNQGSCFSFTLPKHLETT